MVASYLLGSVPMTQLIARWRCDADLRHVGVANVGPSNLRLLVGPWMAGAAGILDVAKGTLPVLLGQRFGFSDTWVMLAGLAAIMGHDWSVWLRFQGGRGMATTLGVLLLPFPVGCVWVIALLALGAMIGQTAPLHALGVLTLPVLSAFLGEPIRTVCLTLALAGLMVVKRIEANQRCRPVDRRVWFNRLLLDRDIV